MNNPPPAEPGARVSGWLTQVTALFLQVTEAGAVLTGFIVLVHILLGANAGPYVASVVANLMALIAAASPQAVVGIAIVLALLHLGKARR